MSRLRRAECSGPGITRRRRGRGLGYLDDLGERVEDPEVLRRIRELVIPPAWTDVWICPYPNGHIQAIGTDVAGRRQYRYHDKWRQRRDQEKFDEMLAFARALPHVRVVAAKHVKLSGMPRERVLAVPSGSSTGASSGSAARTTPNRIRPTGWRRCRSAT